MDTIANVIVLEQGKTFAGQSTTFLFVPVEMLNESRCPGRRPSRFTSRRVGLCDSRHFDGREARSEQGYGHGNQKDSLGCLREVSLAVTAVSNHDMLFHFG
jgi:hypothetical protein